MRKKREIYFQNAVFLSQDECKMSPPLNSAIADVYSYLHVFFLAVFCILAIVLLMERRTSGVGKNPFRQVWEGWGYTYAVCGKSCLFNAIGLVAKQSLQLSSK